MEGTGSAAISASGFLASAARPRVFPPCIQLRFLPFPPPVLGPRAALIAELSRLCSPPASSSTPLHSSVCFFNKKNKKRNRCRSLPQLPAENKAGFKASAQGPFRKRAETPCKWPKAVPDIPGDIPSPSAAVAWWHGRCWPCPQGVNCLGRVGDLDVPPRTLGCILVGCRAQQHPQLLPCCSPGIP